jgi:hypothetical protein
LPLEDRYLNLRGHGKVCRIQKEYPTPRNLEKSRRQGWDICLLRSPAVPCETATAQRPLFDRLDTEAIVEFGLNAERKHLLEDVRRLAHKDVRADFRYAVHLMRVSGPQLAARLSLRDGSPSDAQTKAFSTRDWIVEELSRWKKANGVSVTVLLCFPARNGGWLWRLTPEGEESLSSP